MQPYANYSRQSGVLHYELGADYITVEFSKGPTRFYKYTYQTPGQMHVETMKQLAQAGRGLNSYINSNPTVKNGYETKW